MILSKRMTKWAKDETTVSSEEAKMSMESYAIQVGTFEENVKRLVEASKNYHRASYMLKKVKYWYAKKRCSFLSVARVIDALEEYSEQLSSALAPFMESNENAQERII